MITDLLNVRLDLDLMRISKGTTRELTFVDAHEHSLR